MFYRPGRRSRVRRLLSQYRIDHVVAVLFLEQHGQPPGDEIKHLGLDLFASFERLQMRGYGNGIPQIEIDLVLDQGLHHPDGSPAQCKRVLGAGGGQTCGKQAGQRVESICQRDGQARLAPRDGLVLLADRLRHAGCFAGAQGVLPPDNAL